MDNFPSQEAVPSFSQEKNTRPLLVQPFQTQRTLWDREEWICCSWRLQCYTTVKWQ